jgi:hypothetical protein
MSYIQIGVPTWSSVLGIEHVAYLEAVGTHLDQWIVSPWNNYFLTALVIYIDIIIYLRKPIYFGRTWHDHKVLFKVVSFVHS